MLLTRDIHDMFNSKTWKLWSITWLRSQDTRGVYMYLDTRPTLSSIESCIERDFVYRNPASTAKSSIERHATINEWYTLRFCGPCPSPRANDDVTGCAPPRACVVTPRSPLSLPLIVPWTTLAYEPQRCKTLSWHQVVWEPATMKTAQHVQWRHCY